MNVGCGIDPISLDMDTPEEVSPLDIDVLKIHLAVDGSALDSLIELYAKAATVWAEGEMHRSIMSRTHRWTIRRFPYGYDRSVKLPRGKTTSVEGIQYYQNGSLNVMTGPSAGSPGGSDYQEFLSDDTGAILMPSRNRAWPLADWDVPAPITITYTAGWASADDVPPDIIHALMFAVDDMIELRGTSDFSSLQAIAAGGKTADARRALLSGYRIERFY